MSLLQPLPIALLACIMVGAWAAGFFAATYEGRWRRRYADERAFYAQYRAQTDRLNAEKTRRIAELEEDNALLSELLAGHTATARPTQPDPEVAPPVHSIVEPKPDLSSAWVGEECHEPGGASATITDDAANLALADAVVNDSMPVVADIDAAPLHIALSPIRTHPNVVPQIGTAAQELVVPVERTDAAIEAVGSDAPPSAIDHELTQLRGVDIDLAGRLGGVGLHRIADIHQMSAEQEKAIEFQLGLALGHITSEQWRLQAALLSTGEASDAIQPKRL